MSDGRRHQQQQQQQHPGRWKPQSQQDVSGAAQSSHGLLASYPPASITSTAHVARHLSNMAISPSPSVAHPPSTYHPQQPPPYSEYDHPYAAQPSGSYPLPDGSRYWEHGGNQAMRTLSEPMNLYFPAYSVNSTWPAIRQSTHYPTPPLAHHIFQHTFPQIVPYPTPLPQPTASSSSLAFALGPPGHSRPNSGTPPAPQAQYHPPTQSDSYFATFLQTQSTESQVIDHRSSSKGHHPMSNTSKNKALDSPDPLALVSSSTNRSVGIYDRRPSTPLHTPRKRKSESQIHSPSLKRVQVQLPSHTPRPSKQLPLTPKRNPTNGLPATPTSDLSPGIKYRLAYVEVPPKPWLTPKSSPSRDNQQMEMDGSPDLGGYASSNDEGYTAGRAKAGVSKGSVRRTGDRDERAPIEKLRSFLDDVFEAEDALSPDAPLSSLPHDIFSRHTSDPSRPLLHQSQLQKTTKLFANIARSRSGASKATSATPKAKRRVTNMETSILSRILKMLERSVKMGQDLDPFRLSIGVKGKEAADAKDSRASPTKKTKAESSKSPQSFDEDESTSASIDHAELTVQLEVARDSVLAADSCLAILTSDRLPKELYSEELITEILGSIQNQLTKIIYPFVEASSSSPTHTQSISSALLRDLVKDPSGSTNARRRILTDTFQALSSCIPRINQLVSTEIVAMSDAIIIQAVYISIGPFFVADLGSSGHSDGPKSKKEKEDVVFRTFGKSAMRGLRLDALSLIRIIFAKHEEQRSWIIEEILNSLIKLSDTKQKAGQFRLRNGQSIRTVSALLMQLVQTSAHDVRIEASRIRRARQHKLQRQDSSLSMHGGDPRSFLDDDDSEEIRLYAGALDSANKAAKSVIVFLTSRSGKGKTTRNSNEAEYRAIFDNLISDVLTVLYWPEWPAASLILGIVTRFMVSSLDDITTSQNDNNAVKSMAIDQLGVIASRIRQSALKVQKAMNTGSGSTVLRPLDEVVLGLSAKEFDLLLGLHKDIAYHLSKQSSEDQAYDSARELTAASLGQELALCLKTIDEMLAKPDVHERSRLRSMGAKVKSALSNLWNDNTVDVFDIDSAEEVQRIDRISEDIGTIQSLSSSFPAIINVIVLTLDAPAIFMRTKALRALGQVATIDPSSLSSINVRKAIESRLLDNSSAVRDAAVELIGKCMLDSSQVADDYWQKIAERIADTGVNVRKRVLRLLKALYTDTESLQRRIDIVTRIALRTLDEDDGVKDLALKTIQELWFEDPTPPIPSTPSRHKLSVPIRDKRSELQNKVIVIMGVTANFKDHQTPLEDLLHHIIADKLSTELEAMHQRYSDVCAILIDGLVDATDLPGFTVLNCVKAIHLFTSAHPMLLSASNLSTLLPYLNSGSSPEDQVITDRLLKIFRVTIPHVSKASHQFGQELQVTLQSMIMKPLSGIMILQETVACMCVVVQHLTHEYTRLVALMKSCNGRLQAALKKSDNCLTLKESQAYQVLILIVSLLAEHFDFEALRSDTTTDTARNLDSISERPLIEHIYHMLLKLYQRYNEAGFRGRILQCLGFLFRAQPTLMTEETSAMVMDAIFKSSEEQDHIKLLKIMRDFLVSEALKNAEKQKGSIKVKPKLGKIDMDELVGNTDGFADSGVASAIVQRYVRPIQRAALSTNPALQSSAVDIMSFSIRQGLSHPLESFPIVVALETSPNQALSARANALHALMHGKHSSILNTRILPCARTSFEYQQKLTQTPIQGIRLEPAPVALLHYWYSLMKEKRSSRQDMLRGLLRVFDIQTDLHSTQDSVDFARYIAENLSALDYKTQEEPLTIIKHITTTLSIVGLQVIGLLSPSEKVGEPLGPSEVPGLDVETRLLDLSDLKSLPTMRSSIIVGMAMLLKTYLKTLYGLTEEKCSKFLPGKKNSIGDKPAVKRGTQGITWARLPYAIDPLISTNDMEAQKTHFLELWNEDGVRPEPEEEDNNITPVLSKN